MDINKKPTASNILKRELLKLFSELGMRQENLSSSQRFFWGGARKIKSYKEMKMLLFLDYMVAYTETQISLQKNYVINSLASFLETKLMYTFLNIFILQNKVRKYKVAKVTIFINIKNIKFLDMNLMKDI